MLRCTASGRGEAFHRFSATAAAAGALDARLMLRVISQVGRKMRAMKGKHFVLWGAR